MGAKLLRIALSLPPLADVGFGRWHDRVSAVSPVCHGGEGNLSSGRSSTKAAT